MQFKTEAEADNDIVRAFDLLGGRKTMTTPVCNALEAHDLLVQGIPSRALLHLVKHISFLEEPMALEKAVGISMRTLQRRKSEKSPQALSTEQSSRAWQFAEIMSQAIQVLGSRESAEEWMNKPAIGLAYRKPIDLLASRAGAEAVSEYLSQMEYGVYI